MKKTFAALAIALALPAVAQQYVPAPVAPPVSKYDINPGALQLTAKSNFNWKLHMVDDGSPDVKDIRAGLGAMYFVSHFLGFGLDLTYDHHQPQGDTYQSTFYFGPKAGLDWTLFRHFSVFADASVGIARGELKVPAADPDPGQGIGLSLTAGFRLFANRNVSLDLFGSYDQLRLSYDVAGDRVESNLQAGVALSVYLTNNPAMGAYP
jgi:opacity protein-like surface antigen